MDDFRFTACPNCGDLKNPRKPCGNCGGKSPTDTRTKPVWDRPAPPSVAVPEGLKSKVMELCSAVENDEDLPPVKYALKCGRLINEVKDMLTAAPSPDHIADAGKVVASSWKSAKTGQHWPHIGGKYLIKLNGVLQHEIYEFDQGDDGMGSGEYFWDREDLDEAAPFNPEKDEWLPIDEAGTATPSVPENEALPVRYYAICSEDEDLFEPDDDGLDSALSKLAELEAAHTGTAWDLIAVVDLDRLRTAGDEGEE